MLTTLCLLAYTAAVHAECAWVLWWEETGYSFSYRTAEAHLRGGNNYPREERSWNILGSHTSMTACEEAQEKKIDQMLKNWRKQKAEAKFGTHTINHEPGTNIISKRSEFTGEYTSTHSQSLRYLCLPSTIDPRTGKGM
jgi:hypothetical protein